jgi:hypothetical protein
VDWGEFVGWVHGCVQFKVILLQAPGCRAVHCNT